MPYVASYFISLFCWILLHLVFVKVRHNNKKTEDILSIYSVYFRLNSGVLF